MFLDGLREVDFGDFTGLRWWAVRLGEAAELLDVEVEKVARMLVLVALGRRFWRFEGGGGLARLAEPGPRSGLRDAAGSRTGVRVHVVRAGGRWVWCSSTTSLPDPRRADNVLKHDN
jgi:hypothetical protein